MSKKLRNLLFGAIGLSSLVFVIIAAAGISMLSSKSRSMVELKVKSANLDAQLINLGRAKKDVEKYKSFNDIAATVIPKDKNQVQAIAEIFQIADETGILLQSVTFPTSSLGGKPVNSQASQNTQASAGQSTSTQTVISQAKPFTAIPGLYSLELTVTPQNNTGVPDNKKITYPKFIKFLSSIENNRRTAQITQVTIRPENNADGNPEYINFTLTLNVFIKP